MNKINIKEDSRFNGRRINERNIDELIGLSRGIIADGKVDQSEVEFLQKWLVSMSSQENPIINNLLNRITDMLKDNFLDDEESAELLETLTKFTGSDFDLGEIAKSSSLPLDNPEPDIIYEEKNFCFTGTFIYGTRKDCESAAKDKGGKATSLNMRTDYLVIGAYATDSWIHSSYGRKIEKGVYMREKGKSEIKIVSEQNWSSSL